MSMSDEFEYESDDFMGGESDCDEEAIAIENTFYEAEDNKQHAPQLALEQFERVLTLGSAKKVGRESTGEGGGPGSDQSSVMWKFKALQNIVILSARLGRCENMAARYSELLTYMDEVTRNEASDAINTVLDSVLNYTQSSSSSSSALPSSSSSNQQQQQQQQQHVAPMSDASPKSSGTNVQQSDLGKLETMYELTLEALQQKMNAKRLWFSTSVKLAKLYLDKQNTGKLNKVVRSLHKSCMKPDGSDDDEKASQLVEVYALEIQLCTLTKNTVRMKQIYPKTINLTSAIADPRNIAVIRERGGKMFMGEKKWQAAYNEFFEAFKNYQETGNSRAKLMLKYVVVANVLALSSINPFDSREAKVYADDPEIRAVAQLRVAYEQNDIRTIDELLNNPECNLKSDAFISQNLDDLQRNIRLQILENCVKPYRSVKISFLAEEVLNIDPAEVVCLLVELILDGKIEGRIDECGGYLTMQRCSTEECAIKERYTSECGGACSQSKAGAAPMIQWVSALERIHHDLLGKLSPWTR